MNNAFDDLMRTLAGIGRWSPWEKIFTWLPVKLCNKKIVWLKYVQRRQRYILLNRSEGFIESEYAHVA